MEMEMEATKSVRVRPSVRPSRVFRRRSAALAAAAAKVSGNAVGKPAGKWLRSRARVA